MAGNLSDLFESVVSVSATVGAKGVEKGGTAAITEAAQKIGWAKPTKRKSNILPTKKLYHREMHQVGMSNGFHQEGGQVVDYTTANFSAAKVGPHGKSNYTSSSCLGENSQAFNVHQFTAGGTSVSCLPQERKAAPQKVVETTNLKKNLKY